MGAAGDLKISFEKPERWGMGGGEACPEFVEGGFFLILPLLLFFQRRLALSGELACPESIEGSNHQRALADLSADLP